MEIRLKMVSHLPLLEEGLAEKIPSATDSSKLASVLDRDNLGFVNLLPTRRRPLCSSTSVEIQAYFV